MLRLSKIFTKQISLNFVLGATFMCTITLTGHQGYITIKQQSKTYQEVPSSLVIGGRKYVASHFSNISQRLATYLKIQLRFEVLNGILK